MLVCFWGVAALITSIAAYVNHIIWAFNVDYETGKQIVIAIVGVLLPFIGVVYGIYLWF